MFDLSTLKMSDLVTVYNSLAAKPIKSFRSSKIAQERTQAVLDEHSMELRADHDEDAVEDFGFAVLFVRSEDAGVEKKSRAAYSDDQTITVAVEENPKRKNTKAHARFKLYKDEMTVAEYVSAVEKKQPGHKRRGAMADLNWDQKHGFITIS